MRCLRLLQTRIVWIVTLLTVLAVQPAGAYSQFTHEQLIDLTWSDTIRPLLLQRFPGATDAALVRAHAFAYGGCLIQDIGYYPFGKSFFSDLAHHARSGDFVVSLFHNAATMDEFAFAIGALSHYIGDSIGHSQGINPATVITFPELQSIYGASVSYEKAPTAHSRTEFGFDVQQVALHNYAARAYRKKIGFRVARSLLYRSFQETYGIRARGILGPARSAMDSYRWAVTGLLPAFLVAQIVLLKDRLPAETKTPEGQVLSREVSASEYAALGLRANVKPGLRAHLLAIIVRIIPKIGALKVLSTKAPSAVTEDLFTRSAVHALQGLRDRLNQIASGVTDSLLPNLNLDTGSVVNESQSQSMDDTHITLALRLAKRSGAPPAPAVRDYVLSYFDAPQRMQRLDVKPERMAELRNALDKLRQHSY